MQMMIKKQIGNHTFHFTVEGKNLFDLALESEKLAFHDVYSCGLCKSKNLRLNAYETKEEGYKYVKIICNDCRGSVTFGQPKKSPDTFYLRKNDAKEIDWKEYSGGGE